MNPIYPYSLSGVVGVPAKSSSNDSNVKTGKSSLDMTDFMKLLAAQMANQDVTNPTDNNQFISQMAQFASLQAIQGLSQLSTEQYGASYVGKKVIVASYDTNGKLVQDTGIVDCVDFSSGAPCISVNCKFYYLSSVMQVSTDTYQPPETPKPEPQTPPPVNT